MVDIETTEIAAVGEVKLWRQFCQNFQTVNTIETFLRCDENVSPTVHKLLKFLITLPVTTASREWSFSIFKTSKNIS